MCVCDCECQSFESRREAIFFPGWNSQVHLHWSLEDLTPIKCSLCDRNKTALLLFLWLTLRESNIATLPRTAPADGHRGVRGVNKHPEPSWDGSLLGIRHAWMVQFSTENWNWSHPPLQAGHLAQAATYQRGFALERQREERERHRTLQCCFIRSSHSAEAFIWSCWQCCGYVYTILTVAFCTIIYRLNTEPMTCQMSCIHVISCRGCRKVVWVLWGNILYEWKGLKRSFVPVPYMQLNITWLVLLWKLAKYRLYASSTRCHLILRLLKWVVEN